MMHPLVRDLAAPIVNWIERKYHRRRRQTTLGRLTPVDCEIIKDRTSRPGCVSESVT